MAALIPIFCLVYGLFLWHNPRWLARRNPYYRNHSPESLQRAARLMAGFVLALGVLAAISLVVGTVLTRV